MNLKKCLVVIEKSKWIMPILSMILGILAFLLIYGAGVLDVTNDSWLINSAGDLSAHYEGWLFFRASEWHFPLGLIDGITYPYRFSVVYMDSIPILAVLFKILSPLLPTTFQYIGLYGLLTYMLQAFFGYKILYYKTNNKAGSLVGSVFFVFSSTMMMRMFGHEALAFHPILLMSIYIYLKKNEYKEKKCDLISWSLLLALAATIQAYFVPMVFIFILAFYCDEIISKKWYIGLAKTIIPTVVLLITMYLFGYFYGSHELNGGGLGLYNSNLNVLFNDMGTSFFASLMNESSTGIWESYAYLGMGTIIIAAISMLGVLQQRKYRFFSKKSIPMLLMLVAFVVLSVQPSIKLGPYTLFEVTYPEVFTNMLGTFRANGRFMWPIMYLIMTYSIAYIIRNSNKRGMIILVICTMLQLIDLIPLYVQKNSAIASWEGIDDALISEEWDSLNKKEIFYFFNPVTSQVNFYSLYGLGKYAYDHNMVMNDFYTSRKDDTAILIDRNMEHIKLLNGVSDDNRLYVFSEIPTEYLGNSTDLYIYELDDIIIGTNKKVNSLDQISFENGIDLLEMKQSDVRNERDINVGAEEAVGCHIYGGGVSFGPYITVPAGVYHIECSGDNLDNGVYTVIAGNGSENIRIENLDVKDGNASYDIELDAATNSVEFLITNSGSGEILLEEMILSGEPRDSFGEYEIGNEISFAKSDYDAGNHIASGFGAPENEFTWTVGNEAELIFNLSKYAGGYLTCNMNIATVYNGKQSVRIYVDDEIVFDQLVSNGDEISFRFEVTDEQLTSLKLELPDAVSPAETGESDDSRQLALAVSSIAFDEGD